MGRKFLEFYMIIRLAFWPIDRFYHEGQPRIFAENWLRRVSRDRLYSACFVLAILLSVPSCHFVPFNLKLG
ncbi:hypothetical protein BDV32DRAFT_5683 [Aspergillus pseudonomiae]|nr:hypothetical protein BDV32DRAFT_5683 [Aspergillus pseudonomiae]